MVRALDDDVMVFGDDVIRTPMLKDLSGELLVECIDEQLADPTYSQINFLEAFKESYNEDYDEAYGDDDGITEIKNIADDFYWQTILKISKKFDLGISEDAVGDIGGEDLQNLAEGLYEFFVINYTNNVTTYLTNMCISMKMALADTIKDNKAYPNDIVTDVMASRIHDAAYAVILANINSAVNMVKDIEMDTANFIDFFNEELFSVTVVKLAIKNQIITGDFVPAFLEPLYSRTQDGTYDTIVMQVQQNLYQEYQKEYKGKGDKEDE